jgi:hypothetical protein
MQLPRSTQTLSENLSDGKSLRMPIKQLDTRLLETPSASKWPSLLESAVLNEVLSDSKVSEPRPEATQFHTGSRGISQFEIILNILRSNSSIVGRGYDFLYFRQPPERRLANLSVTIATGKNANTWLSYS